MARQFREGDVVKLVGDCESPQMAVHELIKADVDGKPAVKSVRVIWFYREGCKFVHETLPANILKLVGPKDD